MGKRVDVHIQRKMDDIKGEIKGERFGIKERVEARFNMWKSIGKH